MFIQNSSKKRRRFFHGKKYSKSKNPSLRTKLNRLNRQGTAHQQIQINGQDQRSLCVKHFDMSKACHKMSNPLRRNRLVFLRCTSLPSSEMDEGFVMMGFCKGSLTSKRGERPLIDFPYGLSYDGFPKKFRVPTYLLPLEC